MDLRDLATSLDPPRYLSPVSAWVQHIPFAFLLVDLLSPAAIVELGTHMGDSYCAFCQAVDTLNLPTRCTAIDTWQGDAHAGLYGKEALAALRAHHDPLYHRFSRLLQKTFDQAAADFPNGSIDLLHLDGLHTYQAVRHDFDTWLPKLSKRSVLLLHDTQVTRHDFGVHRLWLDIRDRYPSFEFHHGYGLGVAAVGSDAAPNVLRFLAWANAQPALARDFFASRGTSLLLARSVARVNGLTRQGTLVEDDTDDLINLAPQAAELLAPTTDLKQRLDAQESAVRGHLDRLFRGMRNWTRLWRH